MTGRGLVSTCVGIWRCKENRWISNYSICTGFFFLFVCFFYSVSCVCLRAFCLNYMGLNILNVIKVTRAVVVVCDGNNNVSENRFMFRFAIFLYSFFFIFFFFYSFVTVLFSNIIIINNQNCRERGCKAIGKTEIVFILGKMKWTPFFFFFFPLLFSCSFFIYYRCEFTIVKVSLLRRGQTISTPKRACWIIDLNQFEI